MHTGRYKWDGDEMGDEECIEGGRLGKVGGGRWEGVQQAE